MVMQITMTAMLMLTIKIISLKKMFMMYLSQGPLILYALYKSEAEMC